MLSFITAKAMELLSAYLVQTAQPYNDGSVSIHTVGTICIVDYFGCSRADNPPNVKAFEDGSAVIFTPNGPIVGCFHPSGGCDESEELDPNEFPAPPVK